MLGKSVLLEEDIIKILKEVYEVENIIKIENILGGRACIHCVTTVTEKLILKEYQNNYSLDDIIREYGICNFLNENGINTSKFYKTNDGQTYIKYNERYLTLQKYIDGYVIKKHEAPKWFLMESGKALGKINNILNNFNIGIYEFSEKYFEQFDINEKLKNCEKYIEIAKKENDEYSEQIINDFVFKMENLKHIENIKLEWRKLTFANSHGDYNIQQIICKNETINAIIDFASACNLPVIWEIIRSYTISSKECINNSIEIYSLIEYLESYLINYKLNIDDIKSIFNIYIIQLLRSEYGYKEYLLRKDFDKLELLQFGFWRTNMIRSMLEKEKEYTNILERWFQKR